MEGTLRVQKLGSSVHLPHGDLRRKNSAHLGPQGLCHALHTQFTCNSLGAIRYQQHPSKGYLLDAFKYLKHLKAHPPKDIPWIPLFLVVFGCVGAFGTLWRGWLDVWSKPVVAKRMFGRVMWLTVTQVRQKCLPSDRTFTATPSARTQSQLKQRSFWITPNETKSFETWSAQSSDLHL